MPESRSTSAASPTAPVVAVVVPASPSPDEVALIVPVDRINKFIIDDTVRGPGRGAALRLVVRVWGMGVPRAI